MIITMSKTYNDKYDYLENFDEVGWLACKITNRHPNKRKARTLSREFHKVGLGNPARWKFRFGEEHDKSSRMHLSRREEAAKRRNRLKHESEEEIERSLNI